MTDTYRMLRTVAAAVHVWLGVHSLDLGWAGRLRRRADSVDHVPAAIRGLQHAIQRLKIRDGRTNGLAAVERTASVYHLSKGVQ